MSSFIMHRNPQFINEFIAEDEFSGEKAVINNWHCEQCNSNKCEHTKALQVYLKFTGEIKKHGTSVR